MAPYGAIRPCWRARSAWPTTAASTSAASGTGLHVSTTAAASAGRPRSHRSPKRRCAFRWIAGDAPHARPLRATPEGRCQTPEVWKALFMHACGHAVQFENGLNGQPFPTGFRSSRLTKAEMSELIECILEYGARHGVRWSDPEAQQAA